MSDIWTLVSLGGLALLGGERGISIFKVKFAKNGNGNGNGHAKAPSLPEIQVALQESQFHGLSEVRESIKASQEPVVNALNDIKLVNQSMLQQMTRIVTLQEANNGYRSRAKRRTKGK